MFAIVGVPGSIIIRAVRGALRAAPGTAALFSLLTLSAFLLLGVVTQSINWLTITLAVAFSALSALVGSALVIRKQITVYLPNNGFGMCTGMPSYTGTDRTNDAKITRQTVPAQGPLALTEWLHVLLQDVAGQSRDQPVTFYDLWFGGVPRTQELIDSQESETPLAGKERRDRFEALDKIHNKIESEERQIELVLVTTNVTRGVAYQFPFVVGAKGSLAYSPAEFRTLFPASVVDWMVKHSPSVGDQRMRDTRRVSSARGVMIPDDLRWLPHPADLPIIVGTRMSLSFPLLLTAVPLYSPNPFFAGVADESVSKKLEDEEGVAVEKSRQEEELKAPMQRCWFSDGGLKSNFPIHLFDSPLPVRPTFAIDLADADGLDPQVAHWSKQTEDGQRSADANNMIRMARTNSSGRSIPFVDFEYGPRDTQLANFLMGLFDASRNWADNQLTVMPGYRDRIVRIAMRTDEGGLNLNMPNQTIASVAERGEAAARFLKLRFDSVTPVDPDTGKKVILNWENHQWVRYRSFMAGLEHLGRSFLASWSKAEKHDDPYNKLIRREPDALPSYRWTHNQQQHAKRATDAFLEFVREHLVRAPFDPNLRSGTPRAKARWRGMPPLDDDPRGERIHFK